MSIHALGRGAVLLCLFVLGACGGGGGGGSSTSISVSPHALSYSGEAGDAPPAAQNVTVEYTGDGVIAGYPPSEAVPGWLYVTTVVDQPGHAVFQVSVSSSGINSAQLLSTTLRFVTGHVDSAGNASDIVYSDVAVSYNVEASTLAVTAVPQQLSFAVPAGAVSAPQTLQLTSTGDETDVVDASGVLQVSPGSISGRGAHAVQVAASAANLQPGSYDYQLSVTTFRTGGSSQQQITVPVHVDVGAPLSVTPSSLTFSAVHGSTKVTASQAIQILGDGLQWTASADQPWVHLSTLSGTGAASVSVSADPTGQPIGVQSAHITVQNTQYGQTAMVAVQLGIGADQLVAAPGSVSFSLDAAATAASLAQSISVTDQLGGTGRALSWTLQSIGASWLGFTPASGKSAPAAGATLSLNKAELAKLANGSYSSSVVLAYSDSGGTAKTLVIPVTLTLSLPTATLVTPASIGAGHVVPLLLSGSGLTNLSASQVKLGGAAAQSLEVLSDSAARATFPALGAGSYVVSIANVTGQNRATGTETVVASTIYPSKVFDSSGGHARLIFDDARQTLYSVVQGGQIDRYHYDGTDWQMLSPWVVANLNDAAFSPDQKYLITIGETSIYRIALDDPGATPQLIHSGGLDQSSALFYWAMGVGRNGHVILTTRSHLYSGVFSMYDYDLAADALTAFPYPVGDEGAFVQASGDGSLLYASAYNGYRYDAIAGSLTTLPGPINIYYYSGMDASGDRFGYNGGQIYDQNLVLLGQATQTPSYPVISQDGKRAYAYREEPDNTALGQNVHVVDLTGALQSGGVYPELAAVPLAADPGQAVPSSPIAATVSADGRTYFIAGLNELVIMALPAN